MPCVCGVSNKDLSFCARCSATKPPCVHTFIFLNRSIYMILFSIHVEHCSEAEVGCYNKFNGVINNRRSF